MTRENSISQVMRKGIRLQIVFVSSNSNQGSTGSGGDRPYDTGRDGGQNSPSGYGTGGRESKNSR
ncbi:MAG TPA: hypothetical protein VLB73_00595 [Patescibacteria group bacterium]|nr:hypothetical protein [Patescibacteria group bacterium]